MAFFDPRIGRPSTPMETYLRLMFLKFRYRLGYDLADVLPDPAGWVGAASDDADEADDPLWAGGGGRSSPFHPDEPPTSRKPQHHYRTGNRG